MKIIFNSRFSKDHEISLSILIITAIAVRLPLEAHVDEALTFYF